MDVLCTNPYALAEGEMLMPGVYTNLRSRPNEKL